MEIVDSEDVEWVFGVERENCVINSGIEKGVNLIANAMDGRSGM